MITSDCIQGPLDFANLVRRPSAVHAGYALPSVLSWVEPFPSSCVTNDKKMIKTLSSFLNDILPRHMVPSFPPTQ